MSLVINEFSARTSSQSYMFVFDCSDVCLHHMWERGKAKDAWTSPPSKSGTWNGCLFLCNLWTLMICTGHDKQNRVALGSKCIKPIPTSIEFLSPFSGDVKFSLAFWVKTFKKLRLTGLRILPYGQWGSPIAPLKMSLKVLIFR